jgi:hypothetical protein
VVIAEEFAIPGVKQVVIFGSWAARYAGRAGPPPHDIDVLVVGKVDPALSAQSTSRPCARRFNANPTSMVAALHADRPAPLHQSEVVISSRPVGV